MAKTTKTYRMVVAILEQNLPSGMTRLAPRDSDAELIVQILQRILGAGLDHRQLSLLRSINFESVTRCRRKLQEGGEFLPSPEVARKRRLKSYEVQQTAPTEAASGIQRRIELN